MVVRHHINVLTGRHDIKKTIAESRKLIRESYALLKDATALIERPLSGPPFTAVKINDERDGDEFE